MNCSFNLLLMENEVNLPFIGLDKSQDLGFSSWNCSLIMKCVHSLSSSMLKHVFVQYYKVTFTLGFDQNYELKSIRLDCNLLPRERKKVENFDFWGIFDFLIKKGYFFVFGPKGDKSPSLEETCTFCRLVFVWILLSFWLNDWRVFDHMNWSYKLILNLA